MNQFSRDRLFVPLSRAPFEWFESGLKSWELRRYGRQYTEKHVFPGRLVELRRGYSDPNIALWGKVLQTVRAESLQQLFYKVPFNLVIPPARTEADAISMCAVFLRIAESESATLFAFEIELQPTLIQIAPEFVEQILDGNKRTTIRLGKRHYRLGPAIMRSKDRDLNVQITGLRITSLSALSEHDAIQDGFRSLEDLRKRLSDFYPSISEESTITIVEFCRI